MSYILVKYEADNRLEIRTKRHERVSETHFYRDENGKSLKAIVLNSASLIFLKNKKMKMENEERILVEEDMSPVKAQEKRPAKELEGSPMKKLFSSTMKKEIESPIKSQDKIIVQTKKGSPIKYQERTTVKEQEDSSIKEGEMRPMKRTERSTVRKQKEKVAKENKDISGSEWEVSSEDRSDSEWEMSSEDESDCEWEESPKGTSDNEWEDKSTKRSDRSTVKKQKDGAAKEQKNISDSEWKEILIRKPERSTVKEQKDISDSEWKEISISKPERSTIKEQKDILGREWEENPEEKKEEEKEEETRSKTKKSRSKDRHRAHYCFFCKNKFKRINKHLKCVHKKERQVKEILASEDRRERLLMWKILLAKGDLIHNRRVLEGQGGQLITAIKKSNPNVTERMVTCENCWDIQKAKRLPEHRRYCSIKPKNAEKPPKIYENLNDDGFYEEVLNNMKDGFPNFVLGNKLFYSYGRALWEEKGFKNSKGTKQKLRYLRLLWQALQEGGENKNIEDYLNPNSVDQIHLTIKKMTGFKRIKNELSISIPSKLPKLIDLIEEVAKHERINAMKKEDEARAKQISNFIAVFESQTTKALRKLAKNYMKTINRKSVEDLPTLGDVWVITRYLEEEAAVLGTKLKDNPDQDKWILLRDNLVVWLGLFNRRRGGASEHLKLADYIRARKVAAEDLVCLKNATDKDLDFLKSLLIAEVHHKEHTVLLYIPKLLQEALQIFVAHRWVANLSEKNEYVFAAVNDSSRPVRTTNVFRKYKNLLPPESRDKMTFTNLRKQGTTLIQVLDLNDGDLENWALHLGHSRRSQKKFYTLKGNLEPILNNGKILSLLRNGNLMDHIGKKLDDIPLELDTKLPTLPNHGTCYHRLRSVQK